MGVQSQEKGYSGSIDWKHTDARDEIAVFSPLGGQIATLLKTSSEVVMLLQNGQSVRAADAESLTDMTLGWRLPLTGLSDWVLGRPTAGAISHIEQDAQGHIIKLTQEGWDIEYSQYAAHADRQVQLPRKIMMTSPKLNLKFVVESWAL
jgi:outer membrane lipoprotein LolB